MLSYGTSVLAPTRCSTVVRRAPRGLVSTDIINNVHRSASRLQLTGETGAKTRGQTTASLRWLAPRAPPAAPGAPPVAPGVSAAARMLLMSRACGAWDRSSWPSVCPEVRLYCGVDSLHTDGQMDRPPDGLLFGCCAYSVCADLQICQGDGTVWLAS